MSIQHIRVIVFLTVVCAAFSVPGRRAAGEDTANEANAGKVTAGNGNTGDSGDANAETGEVATPVSGEASHANPVGAANGSAVAVVKQLNASLQNVLQNAQQLGYQGRVERLSPILDAAFDFNYMAAKTVGRYWSELTPEQQKRWVSRFADLTKATYAGRFNQYSGQKFEFVDQQAGANGSEIVRSKVVNPGEDDVDLSYRLAKTPEGWKVVDVYFKGTVSELAMRRADYSSVLKRDGFDALLTRVNEKIAELSAGGAPD